MVNCFRYLWFVGPLAILFILFPVDWTYGIVKREGEVCKYVKRM